MQSRCGIRACETVIKLKSYAGYFVDEMADDSNVSLAQQKWLLATLRRIDVPFTRDEAPNEQLCPQPIRVNLLLAQKHITVCTRVILVQKHGVVVRNV